MSHDRTGKPVVDRDTSHESGHEIHRQNPENEQIRTVLDRQREQILADCQAEIKKYEFQADYDRRSKQKLIETIESQQEELHRAQAEEPRRQDHQLLHEQLLKQNWDLREAHEKSLNEMEELKKFQGATFDTITRRRIDEDQDTILELTGKIQELQTCVFPTSSNSWLNAKPFKKECRAAKMGRQAFGTRMVFRETFLQVQLRPLQHLIRRN